MLTFIIKYAMIFSAIFLIKTWMSLNLTMGMFLKLCVLKIMATAITSSWILTKTDLSKDGIKNWLEN